MNTSGSRIPLLVASFSVLLSATSLAEETDTDEVGTAAPSPEFWLQPAIKTSSEGAGVGVAARLLRGGTSYTVEVSGYTRCFVFCSTQDREDGDTSSISLMQGSYTRSGRTHYGYEYGLAYIERENGNDRDHYEGLGIPLKASATLDGYAIGVGFSIEFMLAEEPYVAAGLVIPFGKLW